MTRTVANTLVVLGIVAFLSVLGYSADKAHDAYQCHKIAEKTEAVADYVLFSGCWLQGHDKVWRHFQ